MRDSEIKLKLIRLIDRQRGESLMRLYELICKEMGTVKSKVESQELTPIELGYQAMSKDEAREEDASEWIEGTLDSEGL